MTTTETLLDWYSTARPEHLEAGLRWYPEADALARRIESATGGRVTRLQACGVIAALSPRCSWPDNKKAALETVLAWADGRPTSAVTGPIYGENIVKAYRILDFGATFGVDGAGVCDGSRVGARGGVVPCRPAKDGCTCPLHGPKVSAFFRAIAGTAQDGCMDVWATRAARVAPAEVCELAPDDPRRAGVPAFGEHATLTAAYRDAAAAVDISPRAFQAVVWLVIRDTWIDNRPPQLRRLVQDQDLPF